MSDILSDMKKFTVRDLDREPGLVLDTCDKEGEVCVVRRDGRRYTVRPAGGPDQDVPWLALWSKNRARIKRIFPEVIPQKQVDTVDRLIAGE